VASLQGIRGQFIGAWARLSAGHKLILIMLFLLCGATLAGVFYWAGKPEYQVLRSGLSAKDCAKLVESLKDEQIPVRVTDGGSALLVPGEKLHEARMVAAEKGVLGAGASGFEIFREPKIGMTPFAERINYVYALQNELAVTISSLDSVEYARVHLVIPEGGLFKEQSPKATASVLIAAAPGWQLTASQTAGIANLVASSVKGLRPEDVTVADAQGNVLKGRGQAGSETAVSDQWSYRQKVEEYLARKAETMLSKVLGPGRSEVRVSADVEFRDVKETSREYDPDKRVIARESYKSSESKGGSSEVGGPVGAVTLQAGGQGQSAASGGGLANETKTEDSETEYLVSESVKELVDRGATIKRLAVAAFVHLAVPEDAEGEEQAPALTIEDVTEVIKDAVGYDKTRGDTLRVVEASFYSGAMAFPEASGGKMPAWLKDLSAQASSVIFAVVLLIIARRLLRSIGSGRARQVVAAEVVALDEENPSIPQGRRDRLILDHVTKYVQENPHAAGRVLEGWIEGEE